MAFIRMTALLCLLLPGYALAQSEAVDCSLARDPERCLINQAALAACADQRGKSKTACLNQHIPPIDCSRTANPARCEAAERAKQKCGGQNGKALKACLQGEKKVKKAGKAKAGKAAKATKKAKKTRAARKLPG